MPRWIRTLQAQLFLWAVLPVTFLLIALAFTGVYRHQQMMRDFVASRDLELTRLTARLIQDGLAHGTIAPNGEGLTAWMVVMNQEQPQFVWIVDRSGKILAHNGNSTNNADQRISETLLNILTPGEDARVLPGNNGELWLVTSVPIAGTDWWVTSQEPVEGLIDPLLRFSSLGPIVALGAGLFSVLLLSLGWKFIVEPLQRLARSTEEISWGRYSALNIPVTGVQEIRDLHSALNGMVERILSYQTGMQDYISAVTQGQEEERLRLAQEIHDGALQDVIALEQRAVLAQRQLHRQELEKAETTLTELHEMGHQAVTQLRRLLSALRPTYLDELGLAAAVERLVQEADHQSSAHVHLIQINAPMQLPSEIELAAYRIIQEALNNALKHSQAGNIAVEIVYKAEKLGIHIRDDGRGFILPKRPDLLTRAGHFGLIGMQERAVRLNADFEIRTAPGAGTEISVQFATTPPNSAGSPPQNGGSDDAESVL